MSDTDSLLAKVEAAAKEHLPEAVGNTLRERLKQADQEREDLHKLRDEYGELEKASKLLLEERNELKAQKASVVEREQAVTASEKCVCEREYEVRIREKLIDLREAHAGEKVELVRGVVKDVFSNNRFKYERTRTGELVVPGQDHIPPHNMPDGGWHQGQFGQAPGTQPTTETETVEGEGDTPPSAQ